LITVTRGFSVGQTERDSWLQQRTETKSSTEAERGRLFAFVSEGRHYPHHKQEESEHDYRQVEFGVPGIGEAD